MNDSIVEDVVDVTRAAEIASSAFEPFRRGSQSGSLEKGGNGLGLSVVRAIVEAHGGKMRYAPSDTGGALFEIVLGKPAYDPQVRS